jgi:hypothetical protein
MRSLQYLKRKRKIVNIVNVKIQFSPIRLILNYFVSVVQEINKKNDYFLIIINYYN